MKIVKQIALSFMIVLLVLWGLSKVYDFMLRRNCNIKMAYVQKGKINADIIFHGQCEVLWMISPKQMDSITGLSSYNLALSHSDYADNFIHLYEYLKYNIAPKYLFLYVTPEAMDLNYNTFNTYRFVPYLNDPIVDSVVSECDSAFYKWSKVPFMKYAYYSSKVNFEAVQGCKHFMTNRSLPHFVDGYEPPLEIKWDNHLEKFIQLYPHGYNFNWNPKREKYLRKIIELAQSKKVKVFLYESPVLKEAIAYQPNRPEMVKRINAIAQEYGIKYVQFENMEIANSRKYYMSVLNTNLLGSRIFTDSLGKYIKKEDALNSLK